MKKLILIITIISSGYIYSQTDTSAYYEGIPDTNITKEKFLGLNMGTFIKFVMEPNHKTSNFSLLYKVKKSNGLLYQFKIATYHQNKDDIYKFADTLGNVIKRIYTDFYTDIDLRASIGMYDKFGYGYIYILTGLVAGYADLRTEYDNYITIIKDTTPEGISYESYKVSKAGFMTFGINFAFGYEIDLGSKLMMSLEYNPKFTFNTMIDSKYYIEDATKYENNFIISNFNVFNINLLYRF